MPFRLRHPAADAHDRVDVNGTSIELGDDGEFEAPESWARRWCDANGYDLDDVRVTNTCEVVKSDGEVCGRDRPCPYHDEKEEEDGA